MKLLKCKCGKVNDWHITIGNNPELICTGCGEPYPDLHKENEELRFNNDELRYQGRVDEEQNSELEKEIIDIKLFVDNSYLDMPIELFVKILIKKLKKY